MKHTYSALIIAALLILTSCLDDQPGCSTEPNATIINNTEPYIIPTCAPCLIPDCICNCREPTECEAVECSNEPSIKCQLQNGRLISELRYIKNITDTRFSNSTMVEMEENLTSCKQDYEELKDKVIEIEEIFDEVLG